MAKFIELTDTHGTLHYINPDHIIEMKYAPEGWESKTVVYYFNGEKLIQLGVEEELSDILNDLEGLE